METTVLSEHDLNPYPSKAKKEANKKPVFTIADLLAMQEDIDFDFDKPSSKELAKPASL